MFFAFFSTTHDPHPRMQPPPHTRCDRATSLFPAWVLGAAALGMFRPATLAWFDGSFITAALATTMVNKKKKRERSGLLWVLESRGRMDINHLCRKIPSRRRLYLFVCLFDCLFLFFFLADNQAGSADWPES